MQIQQKVIDAGREFYAVIIAKLTNEKGVHAETAIACASRMTGTFLLRYCNLPLDKYEPGMPVLSDAVNECGPDLVGVFDFALEQMEVAIDHHRLGDMTERGAAPHLDVIGTQVLLENEMNAIRLKYQFDYHQAARAAAIGSAFIVKECAAVLDPHVGYQIAAYGFVEGAKTVPQRLPVVNAEKKPWFKLW